jgi:simple sugar transport system substrate-binding protein
MKKILSGIGAALAGALFCLSAQATDPLKIGFVYNSPVGDAGWTYQHDQGRQAVESALGDRVETTFVESVGETDVERVLRQLVQSGHGLIFTTSFGFMNPTLKVAGTAPETRFMHATGYKQADNVGVYHARAYEARYLSGVLAGHMSKTGVAGFIASFPIPEVVRGINAFTLGMRSVNPDAGVKVVWISSWFDPGKETDAANVLISQGADIINQFTDSAAPTQAAQKAGVWSISVGSDRSNFGPDAHLSSVIYDWSGFYIDTATAALEGSWQSGNVWGGLGDGMTGLSALHSSVPAEVAAAVEKARGEIADGSRHPFQGPVRGQDGEVRIAGGTVAADGDLLGMDWYVEGVQGELPQ